MIQYRHSRQWPIRLRFAGYYLVQVALSSFKPRINTDETRTNTVLDFSFVKTVKIRVNLWPSASSNARQKSPCPRGPASRLPVFQLENLASCPSKAAPTS